LLVRASNNLAVVDIFSTPPNTPKQIVLAAIAALTPINVPNPDVAMLRRDARKIAAGQVNWGFGTALRKKFVEKTIQKAPTGSAAQSLIARRMGVDTQYESIIFMRRDCAVCRSEGFGAHARVRVTGADQSIIATVFHVTGEQLAHDEAGFSESAWQRLKLADGATITVSHPRPLASLSRLRAKVYGNRLGGAAMAEIITDITAGPTASTMSRPMTVSFRWRSD